MLAARALLSLMAVCSLVYSGSGQETDNYQTPLSTALYLLSKTPPDSNKEEKACLANSFVNVGQYRHAKIAAELVDNYSYTDGSYILLIDKLIEQKQFKEALDFVTFLRQKDPDFDVGNLMEPLVRLGQTELAFELANGEDGRLNSDNYLTLINALLKLGHHKEAQIAADRVHQTVVDSKYPKDKAELGLAYAELRRPDKALPLIETSLSDVVWTKDLPPADDQRIQGDAFRSYLLLTKYPEALQILDKLGKNDDSQWLIQIAESYLATGDRTSGLEYLKASQRSLNFKEYGDSFDLGKLVEVYLKLGNDAKALDIARRLDGNEYMRQKSLLAVADYYFGKKRLRDVANVLDFAFGQTTKMDTNDVESGQLWTSGKWTQAGYQADIARRFLRYDDRKRAHEIITQIRKPYLKAHLLAEYVSHHQPTNSRSVKTLQRNLEQALRLLRTGKEEIFDTNKYDTYARVARAFAEVGMTKEANTVFAEVLSMDREMYAKGLDGYLLIELCNIGVEFERSSIKSDKKVWSALRNIIQRWENDEY